MKQHEHNWRLFQSPAVGEWTKQEGEPPVYFSGKVYDCSQLDCRILKFVCNDKRLRAVEVTK
jgi:hypothetical protein